MNTNEIRYSDNRNLEDMTSYLESRCEALRAECKRLAEENDALREDLLYVLHPNVTHHALSALRHADIAPRQLQAQNVVVPFRQSGQEPR